jgi:hypothetical protein
MSEPSHKPIFREINLSAEIIRMYGAHWGEPELAYQFGDRKFYLRTGDAGIYADSGVVGCTSNTAVPGDATPGCAAPGEL